MTEISRDEYIRSFTETLKKIPGHIPDSFLEKEGYPTVLNYYINPRCLTWKGIYLPYQIHPSSDHNKISIDSSSNTLTCLPYLHSDISVPINRETNPSQKIFQRADCLIPPEHTNECTPYYTSHYISEALCPPSLAPHDLHFLIDACAGYAGNTIAFAARADHVIAIEIDPQRSHMLLENVKTCGVQDKVSILTMDVKDALPAVAQLIAEKILQIAQDRASLSSICPVNCLESETSLLSNSADIRPISLDTETEDERKPEKKGRKIQITLFASPPWGGEKHKLQECFSIFDVPSLFSLIQDLAQMKASLPERIQSILATSDVGMREEICGEKTGNNKSEIRCDDLFLYMPRHWFQEEVVLVTSLMKGIKGVANQRLLMGINEISCIHPVYSHTANLTQFTSKGLEEMCRQFYRSGLTVSEAKSRSQLVRIHRERKKRIKKQEKIEGCKEEREEARDEEEERREGGEEREEGAEERREAGEERRDGGEEDGGAEEEEVEMGMDEEEKNLLFSSELSHKIGKKMATVHRVRLTFWEESAVLFDFYISGGKDKGKEYLEHYRKNQERRKIFYLEQNGKNITSFADLHLDRPRRNSGYYKIFNLGENYMQKKKDSKVLCNLFFFSLLFSVCSFLQEESFLLGKFFFLYLTDEEWHLLLEKTWEAYCLGSLEKKLRGPIFFFLLKKTFPFKYKLMENAFNKYKNPS